MSARQTYVDIHPASDEAVGIRLGDLREALGYSEQTDWCDWTGFTTQAWNNWERGAARISHDMAMRLCLKTGVDLSWIYNGLTGNMPAHILEKLRDLQLSKRKPRKPRQRRRPSGG